MWSWATNGNASTASPPPERPTAVTRKPPGDRDLGQLHAKLDLMLQSTGQLATAVHGALTRLDRVEALVGGSGGIRGVPATSSACTVAASLEQAATATPDPRCSRVTLGADVTALSEDENKRLSSSGPLWSR